MVEELVATADNQAEENRRLWNSLLSAWVDIDILKDDGKLAKDAKKLEKELRIR